MGGVWQPLFYVLLWWPTAAVGAIYNGHASAASFVTARNSSLQNYCLPSSVKTVVIGIYIISDDQRGVWERLCHHPLSKWNFNKFLDIMHKI